MAESLFGANLMDVLIPDLFGHNDARDLLTRAAHVFAEDECVIACALTGSFASGSADEYSDIDLDILLDPSQSRDFFHNLPKTLAKIGNVLAYRESRWADRTVFVHFEDSSLFRRLDLHFYYTGKYSFPQSGVAYEIIFERDKANLPVVGQEEELNEIDPRTFLERRINTFLMQRMVNVRELKRGSLWHAYDSLQSGRLQIIDMLRCIYTPNRVTAGTKNLEEDLPRDVLTDLRNLISPLSVESIAQATLFSLSFVERYIKPFFKVNNMVYPERLANAIRDLCKSELKDWIE